LPKKVSEKEKEKIIVGFLNGEAIEDLSKKFNCSKITISRHLKNNISEVKYKDLIKNNKKNSKKNNKKNNKFEFDITGNFNSQNSSFEKVNSKPLNSEVSYLDSQFTEIVPLNYEIDNTPQKDISSVPISEIDFPDIVYMIVNKNIELETKYLREYPSWQFLSEEELSRKTIEIYNDLKFAKRFCNKEQKVIKVPNTNVFKIAAPALLEKGITRIVNADKLISL